MESLNNSHSLLINDCVTEIQEKWEKQSLSDAIHKILKGTPYEIK
jgi:hypothetical protein